MRRTFAIPLFISTLVGSVFSLLSPSRMSSGLRKLDAASLESRGQLGMVSQGDTFDAFDQTNDEKVLPDFVIDSLDAVLVLGGGVPSSLEEPPVHVKRRCDVAAAIVQRHRDLSQASLSLPILTLSAGTAHLPQLLSNDGLPIWEATSSAAYLKNQHGLEDHVYVETTSYDTISNAFFARTTHTDVVGWRKLAVITNEVCLKEKKSVFLTCHVVQTCANFRLFPLL